MSNLQREFDDALSLIDGQYYFVATITPTSVSSVKIANGRSVILQNAIVEKGEDQPVLRNVLAFGKVRDQLLPLLRKGRSVRLAVQYEGHTLRALGVAPEAKVAA